MKGINPCSSGFLRVSYSTFSGTGKPRNPDSQQTDARSRYSCSIVDVLAEEGSDLRLREIHRRVEDRLGEELPKNRFKDYVNDQAKGSGAVLERLGYGRYRLLNVGSPLDG